MAIDNQHPFPERSREISLAAQALSLGELATAASILGYGGVLGLDEWFEKRSRQEISHLAEKAAQSLRDRGLLERQQDGSLTIAPWLSFLVETAAAAPHVLILSVAPMKGRERRHLFHLGESMIVEQEPLDKERVSLMNIPDVEGLGERMIRTVGAPDRGAAPGPTFQLPADELEKARQLAQTPGHCVDVFTKAGLPQETAEALCAALTDNGQWGSANMLQREKDSAENAVRVTLQSTKTWLSGDQGSWLVRSTGEKGEFVQLVPTSHAALLQQIVQIVPESHTV